MSRVEQLEQQIAGLDQDELRVSREWFARFDADDRDRPIASDARNSKLALLTERTLRDHEAGGSTELGVRLPACLSKFSGRPIAPSTY
jgi:hypothetical protein